LKITVVIVALRIVFAARSTRWSSWWQSYHLLLGWWI